MKLKLLLTLSVFYCFNVISFAQDEDDESCVEPEDKKIAKLLKVAEDPKAEKMERIKAYTDAIALAPDNAFVQYSFANFNYELALAVQDQFEEGRANYNQLKVAYEGAAKSYKTVIKDCAEFHSDPYYKLGVIYYTLNDKGQASMYFKKFLEFNERDPNKYSDTYSKNKKDVEEILPEMEFFDKFFNSPVPYEPVKVEYVSSDKDEYLPMISPDNELLFFTRKGKDTDKGIVSNVIEEFTLSQRPSPSGDFNSGLALRQPFNTPAYANYGGISLSLDNKEMFICACEEVDYQRHANCDIYVTKFERTGEGGNDFKWTDLENLGPAINTKDGWEAQPTLSADGNTLYFATWREGSQLTDIYYSTRGKDGKWSQARPVPGPINSEGHDKAPFLHQDSETLYFVSDCSTERKGAGGSDIFYTRKENGSWVEPKNIGYPINTAGNEVGLIVSTDGKLAYFTTGGRGSSFDIFYFELYEEARPKKVAFFKGELKDDKGEPVKDAVVEVSYRESGKSVEFHVNGDDGKFAAVVNVDDENPEDIMISAKKEGYSFDTQVIKEEEIKQEIKNTFVKADEMEIQQIEVGKAFTMDNILYPTKSYALSDDAKWVLDQFIKFLNENPTVKVSIQGHTDNKGDANENLVLSENRAKGVVDYLITNGIDKNRLSYEGFGQTKPKVPNTTEENRALNRRTDIMIVEM
ncbi:MAG: OmpA family protein [Crocinitomicaceae bacterium]|nr:OmpA family protein [Crocinitomicaceae bacterium]